MLLQHYMLIILKNRVDMKKVILTMNAGSSSLKFGVFCKINNSKLPLKKILGGQVSQLLSNAPKFLLKDEHGKKIKEYVFEGGFETDPYQMATEVIMKEIVSYDGDIEICATAQRVVHGGDEFKESTLINEDVLGKMEKYIPLAALHQPYNLKIASYFYNNYKSLNHYACFDTAFHQTINPINRAYAIPIRYMEEGIKRYGFHGLSYKYITSILENFVGSEVANKKWIIAHLGSGASLCSVFNKKSVATTMGFSVLEGLAMSTRCGELDPAIVTYLEKRDKLSPENINDILYNHSGLMGLSGGISGDIKALIEMNNKEAQFAIDVFCNQVVLSIGKMVAAAEGCDGIIFTAGIGENSSNIREIICSKLSWLNIKIDQIKNKNNEVHINSINSIPILVIPTNEECIMAIEAMKDLP